MQYDVVVVGYGGAGAMTAVAAADAGARVLLVEKWEHPGGTTILSSGFARVANDVDGAAAYLERTSGGRVDPALVEALARGMADVPDVLETLATAANARVRRRFGDEQSPNETEDLYDWPGRESLGWSGIEAVPGFDGYPWVSGDSKGQLLVRVLEANIEARAGRIDVWLDTPAVRLMRDDRTGRVDGVLVERRGEPIAVAASGGVVLATGGFEFNRQMLTDVMELPTVYPMGHAGNTGDGIVMATQVGAALWHMWHIHGSYGFKIPELPVAIRTPMGGARNPARPVAWILVDQRGRRFTNELPRAPQDTLSRPLTHLDEATGRYDRIPAWLLFDERGRMLGPIGRPVAAQDAHRYTWSRDNAAEVARGWIRSADTLETLALQMEVPASTLLATVTRWNRSVEAGEDADFERPPGSMLPLVTPPFYAIDVWPVCSNTQGGPVHDEHQRVLDARGAPISGLYAVGELGSFFGHIYLLGGNITESIVGGRIAGRHAAHAASQVEPRGVAR